MSKQTISFHLSSSIATERGNSNYELVLSPGLEIPHAAKDCTVYLHNLLFNNCLANVSGPLYQNNQVVLTLSGQTPINIDLGPSALSIPDVERLIGEHLYADQSGKMHHIGKCGEHCTICAQVHGRLRRVHHNVTPVYDTMPGRTIYMDSIYWDCESRHGNWYTAAGVDDMSGWYGGFHFAKRSDVTRKLKEWILQCRSDPELNCQDLCRVLYLDPAGEWSRNNADFMEVMVDELGVLIINPPTQSDKRLGNRGEMVVQQTKRMAVGYK
jgi:hypothetical protein